MKGFQYRVWGFKRAVVSAAARFQIQIKLIYSMQSFLFGKMRMVLCKYSRCEGMAHGRTGVTAGKCFVQ